MFFSEKKGKIYYIESSRLCRSAHNNLDLSSDKEKFQISNFKFFSRQRNQLIFDGHKSPLCKS